MVPGKTHPENLEVIRMPHAKFGLDLLKTVTVHKEQKTDWQTD